MFDLDAAAEHPTRWDLRGSGLIVFQPITQDVLELHLDPAHALELAGAASVGAAVIVSAGEQLLTAAQMMGFRPRHA